MGKKRIGLAVVSVCMMLLMLCSCNKTPDGDYLNKPGTAVQSDSENLHLNGTEKHVTASFTQGELKLDVDADVTAPTAQKIYKRKSDFFDFSDKKFHQLAAQILLGDGYKESEDSLEGQFVYKNGAGTLSLIPEKDMCRFESNAAGSFDQSSENFIENVSLDHEYAVMAKETAAKLGFLQYEPYYCEKYGKTDSDNEFYLITLIRKADNMYVQNTVTQSMAQDNVPPVERIEIEIANGQIWSVYIRAAQIDESGKTETAVIPLTAAMDVLKNSGIGALSMYIADCDKAEITEISLSYVHTPDGKAYKLIPAWVFLLKTENSFQGEMLTDYYYLAIDAESGKIL